MKATLTTQRTLPDAAVQLRFDPTQRHRIIIPHPADNRFAFHQGQSFSVAGIARVLGKHSGPGYGDTLIQKRRYLGGNDYQGWVVAISANASRFVFGLNTPGQINYACGWDGFRFQDTFHYVATYEAATKTIALYVNGKKVDETLCPALSATQNFLNNEPLTLGKWDGVNHTENRFDGLQSHISLYDKALSQAEVQALHKWAGLVPVPARSSCIGYWPLQQHYVRRLLLANDPAERLWVFDHCEQFNYAKAAPLAAAHGYLENYSEQEVGAVNPSSNRQSKDFYKQHTATPMAALIPEDLYTPNKYLQSADWSTPAIGQAEGGSYTLFFRMKFRAMGKGRKANYRRWLSVPGAFNLLDSSNQSGYWVYLNYLGTSAMIQWDSHDVLDTIGQEHHDSWFTFCIAYNQVSQQLKLYAFHEGKNKYATLVKNNFTWDYASGGNYKKGLRLGYCIPSTGHPFIYLNRMFFYANTLLEQNEIETLLQGGYDKVPGKSFEYLCSDLQGDVLRDVSDPAKDGTVVNLPTPDAMGDGAWLEQKSLLPAITHGMELGLGKYVDVGVLDLIPKANPNIQSSPTGYTVLFTYRLATPLPAERNIILRVGTQNEVLFSLEPNGHISLYSNQSNANTGLQSGSIILSNNFRHDTVNTVTSLFYNNYPLSGWPGNARCLNGFTKLHVSGSSWHPSDMSGYGLGDRLYIGSPATGVSSGNKSLEGHLYSVAVYDRPLYYAKKNQALPLEAGNPALLKQFGLQLYYLFAPGCFYLDGSDRVRLRNLAPDQIEGVQNIQTTGQNTEGKANFWDGIVQGFGTGAAGLQAAQNACHRIENHV
ncbi:LamG-like jellyroll fold domain-containing protein [Rapidithrix thailandica]|uniref:LamG-like jellyroll fold domain-containing protein n=1 Tax=Rapidithrix thailandica TaxID=413964 RepID=A0AAW9RZ24_9BACT